MNRLDRIVVFKPFERSAMRAQLLYEALSETPVASIEQQLYGNPAIQEGPKPTW